MVSLRIEDSRIRRLTDDVLKRAFVNQMQTILEINRGMAPNDALVGLYGFFVRYLDGVELRDELSHRGLACAPMHVGASVEETGQIALLIPKSIRQQYSDDEIKGMVAHELGHLYNQYYFGEALDENNGDISDEESERDADEAAEELGSGREIRAIRKRSDWHAKETATKSNGQSRVEIW